MCQLCDMDVYSTEKTQQNYSIGCINVYGNNFWLMYTSAEFK